MRATSTVGVVFVWSAFLLAGCSQSASLTSPTSVSPLAASATSSTPAAAQHQVPFEGTMQGTDTDSNPTATTVVVTTVGTGTATQFGRVSFTQRVTVDFTTGTSAGTSHWQAANGDGLDTTIAGSGQPTGASGEISITETHAITGGTGRFAGAQGSFTVQRLASAITFTTSGSFSGTISSPSSAQ